MACDGKEGGEGVVFKVGMNVKREVCASLFVDNYGRADVP